MSKGYLEKNPQLEDHKLKSESITFEFDITANATPASKKQKGDIPGVVYISTQPDKKSAIAEVKRMYGYGVGVVIIECYECN